MTKKILIINGHQKWEISPGGFNALLAEHAKKVLSAKGYEIKTSTIDAGWDDEDEVQKTLWADVIILQFPVFWFSVPWLLKKYIDEVYMVGYGRLFANDGRTRTDANQHYGSGGLMQGKQIMLSPTWNAPPEALDDPDQFFEGKGNDAVFMWLEKTYEFCGMEALPAFATYDVAKEPTVEEDLKRWTEHLEKYI
ncbi:MAG: NAD(P)H-dependent oxidoreductase [Marinosulfonomonas sp.]|nr:NAD(P)H-dependent oxidoreductase [Marinosulfonomonas sp.]